MIRRLFVYAGVLAAVGGYMAWRVQPPADVLVVLAADGHPRLEHAVLTPPQLTAALRAKLDRQPQPAVQVQVDAQASVTAVVAVVEAVRASGAADLRVAMQH